jgi:hypothetical protein
MVNIYNKSVPTSYFGVWRRALLENSQGQDSTSLVLWMQTRSMHADIRIPAKRPDFSNYSRLEEYSVDDLRWLATQQGFYGTTFVEGDVCLWQRKHDFQPNNGVSDIGKIAFTSESEMLETGVEDPYFEVWHKVGASHLNLSSISMVSQNRYGENVPAYLLSAGNQVAFIRPRVAIIPEAASLLAAIDLYKPSNETLLDWLDFEISFGQKIDDEYWKINHSTHAFREGLILEQGHHYVY